MIEPQRFHIRTYGCQMNVHDSDKLASLLLHAGFVEADGSDDADLLVVNTCSIREKAEHHLYTDLGLLRIWKRERKGRLVGVGGCVAQQVGDSLLGRFAHLDFVFGTHNLRWVPTMVAAAAEGARGARTQEDASTERFDLPSRHPSLRERTAGRAFVTVMEGCDMFCSFCIVPMTRGREISRPARDIVAEVEELASNGIREITLLGQTVNAYGRHDLRRGKAEQAGTLEFSSLLAALDRVPGIERIRYTSPHPLFFDAPLVAAHGELEHLCPHVHLPLQSGSDRVLAAMRRRYTRDAYLEIVASLRRARPDVAITTDLIVAFPGETERDVEDTLELMRLARFADSYSFKYSPRPGTAAAALDGALPADVAQERLEAVQSVQRELTLTHHRGRIGDRCEVLVEGASRRGGGQVRGRDRYHRVVNFEPGSHAVPAPGELVPVEIAEATPHSLLGSQVGAPGPARRLKPPSRSADDSQRKAVHGPARLGAQ